MSRIPAPSFLPAFGDEAVARLIFTPTNTL